MSTRERILQAATDLMLERGLRKVTMEEIAGAIGISKKTLYQAFSSKDELVHALADREFAEWEERGRDLATELPDVVERLHALARYSIDAHRRFGPEIRRDLQADYPEIFEKFRQQRQRHLGNLESLIRSGIAQGQLKDVNPRVAALALSGALQRVTEPDTVRQNSFTADEAAADVYELFLHGLLAEVPARAARSV